MYMKIRVQGTPIDKQVTLYGSPVSQDVIVFMNRYMIRFLFT